MDSKVVDTFAQKTCGICTKDLRMRKHFHDDNEVIVEVDICFYFKSADFQEDDIKSIFHKCEKLVTI